MHLPLAAVTAMLLVAAATTGEAKTITVNNGHDHGAGSLRHAIAAAAAGDTIHFASHVTQVTLTTASLRIERDLAIQGPGAKKLAIRRSATAGTPQFTLLRLEGGTVDLSGLTIADGVNPDGSGGILISCPMATISGCAITDNQGSNGGGIAVNSGTVTIKGTIISGNSALESYAGGLIINGGKVSITRSTIAQNSADSAAGIFNLGDLTIINSTVASNTASSSTGGILNWPGTSQNPTFVRLKNTIVAKNTDANGTPDFSGALSSMGFNLIGNTAGITNTQGETTSNITNVNPLLGPLQDNGGPTQTKALLTGSPAIDKGNSGAATIDQRKLPRPVDNVNIENAGGGNASDIGAFEVQ